jgi:hypothetical protein
MYCYWLEPSWISLTFSDICTFYLLKLMVNLCQPYLPFSPYSLRRSYNASKSSSNDVFI